jgi:hypothetical protein
VALALLLAGAVAVRLWLMVDYGPAFLGFGDSHEYVVSAAVGVFHDVQKPAGYPIFLSVLHALSDSLSFTILVQHGLGVATGLLLYAAVRRTGAPSWLGLIPAAIVFFGGTGLLLEHSLLADPLFCFLLAASVYAAICALWDERLRWPLLAGLAAGGSFWVKTVGLSSALVIPCVLLLAVPGGARRRVLSSGAAASAAAALIVSYVVVQAIVTGYWGYERQGAWNLYGRVATFVDCSHFTPPAGTRFLCPAEPPSRRQPQSYYQYAPSAPAVRRFGGPADAPGYANGLLQRFSDAAIVHEPLAYAAAILRGLSFYVSPRWGEGYTPESIREALLEPQGVRSIQPAISHYYPHYRGYTGPARAVSALDLYESHTRVQGALLLLMLLSTLVGAPLLSGRVRASALLFTLTAIASVTLAEAGNGYDARYAYPAFGLLAAGAALGAWGVATRLRREVRRLPRVHKTPSARWLRGGRERAQRRGDAGASLSRVDHVVELEERRGI